MKEQQQNKLLIIDDSKTEIKYLELLFEFTDLPLSPTFINSAAKGLEYLHSLNEEAFPDVTIVDINMPLMNGFEFAEQFIHNFKPKFPDKLLFIYSTSINSSDITKAESIIGVSGFLPKPLDETIIEKEVLPYIDALKVDMKH